MTFAGKFFTEKIERHRRYNVAQIEVSFVSKESDSDQYLSFLQSPTKVLARLPTLAVSDREFFCLIFSAEYTIGMVWGLTPLKHYGTMALWH